MTENVDSSTRNKYNLRPAAAGVAQLAARDSQLKS